MKKRLKNISPLQLGVVLGALYAILSLIFAVPFMLFVTMMHSAAVPTFTTVTSVTGGTSTPAPIMHMPAFPAVGGVFLLVFIPCAYGVLGFIGGVISAVIYNIVASITGGIEFTVTDDAS